MSKYNSGSGHGGEKEEMEPEIYVRYTNDGKYNWAMLERRRDVQNQICGCGAQVQLKSLFEQPESDPITPSCTAFGSRIYLFGGFQGHIEDELSEVAYIDVKCFEQGRKVCNNPMLNPQIPGYTFTYDDRVVILHSRSYFHDYHDITQVYYPHTDHWVALPSGVSAGAPPYYVRGHGVVDNGRGKRFVLAHCGTDALYSFDVDANRWDSHWKEGFTNTASSAALVDGIYYVIDPLPGFDRYICGYDIALSTPEFLPVEILPEECGKRKDENWIPRVDYSFGDTLDSTLLSLGNSKLAMIWHYSCLENVVPRRSTLIVFCSIFKMIKSVDGSGDLKLLAQPLSKVSYHVEGYRIIDFLLVYPNKNMDFIAAKKRKIEEEEPSD